MEPGNDKYRLLMEHLPDAFAYHRIVTDSVSNPVDYIFLDVNPAFSKMTGLSREQVIGRKVTEVLPGIKNADYDWIGTYGKVALSGETIRFEEYSAPLERWYKVTAFSDEPWFFAVIFLDITANKNIEEALQKSEEKYRSLFDQSVTGIYLHDLEGRILDVNQAACLQVGYSRDELLNSTVFDLHPNKEDTVNVPKDEILYQWSQWQMGQRLTVEAEHQCKDGTIIPIQISTGPVQYEKNKLILAMVQDITERKQTEQLIQARLNLITFASTNTLDAVLQKTLDEVCDLMDSPIGFYHFLSADENMLTLKAWSTDTLQKFCEIGDKSSMQYSVNEAGVWVDCVRERRPIIHNDYASLPHRKGMPEDHTMVNRELVVPIMRNDRIVAILGIGNKPQNYTDQDIQIVSFFADVAWEITENKLAEQKLADHTLELERLNKQLEEEMDKARQVHERTLPTGLPTVEGVSLSAYYQPAQTLGGDFYDVLRKEGKLVFYLSDVSGHSLDGAMLSVFVKHTIKNYISFTPAEAITPASILRHLAEAFHRENYPEELFICVFSAILDLETMELAYCGAGFQDAPLLRLGSGQQVKLACKGLFISRNFPVEFMSFKEDQISLTPGSTLFCNTDGLTEQGSRGAYYMERLPEVFYENAHLPADLVSQAVVEDFRMFTGGSLQGEDDITFLVLQVDPKKSYFLP